MIQICRSWTFISTASIFLLPPRPMFTNTSDTTGRRAQYPAGSCAQNQCLRNQREWVGGTVTQSQLETVIPVPLSTSTDANMAGQCQCHFQRISRRRVMISAPSSATAGSVNFDDIAAHVFDHIPQPSCQQVQLTSGQISNIESILQSNQSQYKLFYSMAVNRTDQFSPSPPICC